MTSPELESQDELLTAYLDGELSSDESSNVEAQLVVNPSLRNRLADLRKSYDLLDEVPETPYNQSFTRSTVELVVHEISQSRISNEMAPGFQTTGSVSNAAIKKETSWLNWPRFGLLLLGLLACSFLGGLATKVYWRNIEFRQLGLAANVPGLIDVHDLSIAERLVKEKTAFEVLKIHYGEDVLPTTPKSFFERKPWVDSLTSRQLDRIVRGREILKKQSPEIRNRLAALESRVESHGENESLQEVIRIVGLVFDDLPSYKRQDLDSRTVEKRFEFVRDSLLFEAAMVYTQQIAESDVKALKDWYSHELSEGIHAQFGYESNPSSAYIRKVFTDPNFHLQNLDEILPSLLENLSPTARDLLAPLGHVDQTRVFEVWVRRDPDSQQRRVDEYERMTVDRRERWDLMDPSLFRRLYGPGGGPGRRSSGTR